MFVFCLIPFNNVLPTVFLPKTNKIHWVLFAFLRTILENPCANHNAESVPCKRQTTTANLEYGTVGP
jgi:hypothetical protein